MSKKTPKRRAQPRPTEKARTTPAPQTAAPPNRRRTSLVAAAIGGVALSVLLIAAAAVYLSNRPAGEALPSGGVADASPSSAAAGSSTPTTPPGGPLAEAMVAVLHHDPFVGHVEESTVARSTAGTTTVRLTATAKGDVSGPDVDVHVTATGAGPAVDQDVVAHGGSAWIRPAGGSWTVHPRADVATSIDGLLRTIALIDDPTQLVDVGVETIDGQPLHHLAAATSIVYQSADAEGSYHDFDVWVTDKGVPVLAKASFTADQGTNALVGNVDIRYSDIGGPITIKPPAGAPTLKP